MKSFVKTMVYIISIMLTMITFISSIVLSFRVIQLLWQGGINPTLCLECLGLVAEDADPFRRILHLCKGHDADGREQKN